MSAFCIGILAMEKQIDSCLHFVLVFWQWKNELIHVCIFVLLFGKWKNELIHVCILYWYPGNGKTFLLSNETEIVV
jgi:hypothetical protein